MPACAVIGCTNRSARNQVSLHRLPTIITIQGDKTEELSRKRRHQWLSNISRADIKECSYPNVRVCGDHFCHGKPSALYDVSNVDWAPTVKMGHSKIRGDRLAAVERQKRKELRKQQQRRTGEAEMLLAFHETLVERTNQQAVIEDEISHRDPEECTSSSSTHISVQTDLCIKDLDKETEDVNALRLEIYSMRQNQCSRYSKASFEGDDSKVKFYTGLPRFTVLMVLFQFVSPHVPNTYRNVLTPFEEFISVLMRLRLNCPLQDIAYRFGISKSTASRIFEKWIAMMDIRLSHFVTWPDRDILRENMPYDFLQSFGNKVAVIVDCFEVFIDRPTSLNSRAMTWSNYKHHNTVKFLIGISPQGVISYISKAWGGRVSDKHLTEKCSILTNLLPGDIVLADRGFDIADSVGFYCAKLAIPAFTRGKPQLSPLEVEETRRIANVRIHVERVIGSLRQKYQILNSTLPIEMVTCKDRRNDTTIDQIARVCCSLVNVCQTLISFE